MHARALTALVQADKPVFHRATAYLEARYVCHSPLHARLPLFVGPMVLTGAQDLDAHQRIIAEIRVSNAVHFLTAALQSPVPRIFVVLRRIVQEPPVFLTAVRLQRLYAPRMDFAARGLMDVLAERVLAKGGRHVKAILVRILPAHRQRQPAPPEAPVLLDPMDALGNGVIAPADRPVIRRGQTLVRAAAAAANA